MHSQIQFYSYRYLENEDYCFDKHIDTSHIKDSNETSHTITEPENKAIPDLSEEEVELEVDIVSSNTHSVINCLSPYLHSKRDEILAWAHQEKPLPQIDHLNMNEDDKFYVLAYYYFKTFPHLMLEREEEERKVGMKTLKETEFTGIQACRSICIWC